MKKLLLLLCLVGSCLVLETKQVSAQYYKTGIGLRVGWSYGFTIKHFLNDKWAIEGLVTSRYLGKYKPFGKSGNGKGWGNGARGFNVVGLAEYHFPIGKVEGFNWFLGAGAHLGLWLGDTGHPWFPDDPNHNAYVVTGLDVMGGVEYTFKKIPLTLQADIKPSLNFNFRGAVWIWYDEIGISARYTFK